MCSKARASLLSKDVLQFFQSDGRLPCFYVLSPGSYPDQGVESGRVLRPPRKMCWRRGAVMPKSQRRPDHEGPLPEAAAKP